MAYERRIRNALLLLSAVAWCVLIATPGSHCSMDGASGASGWFVMVVAMMFPVLVDPLCHVYVRSFAERRMRAMALFSLGYCAVWVAAGVVLTALAFVPAGVAVVVAGIWQCSPVKQRCLNRCHAHRELAAFGMAADRDSFWFGVSHGAWCVGSCWALMLVPLLVQAHLSVMAVVTVLIFCERLEVPEVPCWRWRGLGRVSRFVVARVRMRFGWAG